MPLAVIKFIDPRTGRPIDPDFGNEGGFDPGHPDTGLPPDPAYPSGGPIYGGGRPDNGLPWAPVRPDGSPILPSRPWPPLPFPPGNFPPGPTDPDWGVGGGPPTHPGAPIYLPPGQIDNGLPPVAGTKPPQNPPPGTIWPPIAGLPEGKAALLAWFYRLGWRYVIVDTSLAPGYPLPEPPDQPPTQPPTSHPPSTEAGYLIAAMGATTMDSTVSLGVPSTTAVVGTVLQIDSEYMTVANVSNPQKLQVARATYGSTLAAHAANAYVSFLLSKPVQPK